MPATEEHQRRAVLRAAGPPATAPRPPLAARSDPLVFATVSGAHPYGFPSRDVHVNPRGAHLPALPAWSVRGSRTGPACRWTAATVSNGTS